MRGDHGGPDSVDRERLREVLGFPATVESGTASSRDPAPTTTTDDLAAIATRVEELSGKVDRLLAQSSALSVLIDNLYDRLDPSQQPEVLTSDDVADIGARMVRILETRLEAHTERIRELLEGRHEGDTVELREVTQLRLP